MESTAINYIKCGVSVIPTNSNKRPTIKEWSSFQSRIPTEKEVKSWKWNSNIALVCGAVSGNLEAIDFDFEGELFQPFCNLVNEQSPGLIDRLVIQQTQSHPNNRHLIYRCEQAVAGSTKLAQKRIPVSGPGNHSYKGKSLQAHRYNGKYYIIPDLIETRGEGGYFLVYPSIGYKLLQGDLTNIPVITAEERNFLIETAISLNQWIEPHQIERGYQKPNQQGNDRLPGQDFDERGDLRGLLHKHGWTSKGNGRDDRELWARPGKDKGWSATLTDNKVFYCFSSNAHPFEQRKAYGPFAVYATLERGGDFREATKALVAQGYGSKGQLIKRRQPRFLNVKAMEKEFGKETEMLWKDLIPKANPSLFGGLPGEGKSTNVAQISKELVLSNQGYWVLWVATEGFVSEHADKWSKLRIPDRVVMLSQHNGFILNRSIGVFLILGF